MEWKRWTPRNRLPEAPARLVSARGPWGNVVSRLAWLHKAGNGPKKYTNAIADAKARMKPGDLTELVAQRMVEVEAVVARVEPDVETPAAVEAIIAEVEAFTRDAVVTREMREIVAVLLPGADLLNAVMDHAKKQHWEETREQRGRQRMPIVDEIAPINPALFEEVVMPLLETTPDAVTKAAEPIQNKADAG